MPVLEAGKTSTVVQLPRLLFDIRRGALSTPLRARCAGRTLADAGVYSGFSAASSACNGLAAAFIPIDNWHRLERIAASAFSLAW